MFSYKASLASNPHTLASTCIVAYLVTWKRGALMPTRTTIFFCSTSRSTRGRWQPVQVFFLVLSSTKPNTKECAPVFYRIFFRRFFWASAEVKSSRWWIVSRNKWPFCGHFLNSLLPFQAWGSKLFFFFLFSPAFMVQQQCKRWFSFCRLFLEPLFHSKLLNYIALASFDRNNWHT